MACTHLLSNFQVHHFLNTLSCCARLFSSQFCYCVALSDIFFYSNINYRCFQNNNTRRRLERFFISTLCPQKAASYEEVGSGKQILHQILCLFLLLDLVWTKA